MMLLKGYKLFVIDSMSMGYFLAALYMDSRMAVCVKPASPEVIPFSICRFVV